MIKEKRESLGEESTYDDTEIRNQIAEISKKINNLKKQHVYGIRRNIENSSSAWERIEDSVGLVANATKDGTEVQNDFDNLYPYSDIISVDINADGSINSRYGDPEFSFINPQGYIMTYVPEFWYKREQKDGYEYIYIADFEAEGFKHSEAFYTSRYTAGGSNSDINSKSNQISLTEISMTELRNCSKSIGDGWGLIDIWKWSILQLLYLVEYADYNSQEKLGYGNSSGESKINSGECDDLGMTSGTLNNNKAHAVIYRGIENIFGNIRQRIDGIYISNGSAWVCEDRKQYISDEVSNSYVKLGYEDAKTNGYIEIMGYDPNYPAIQRAIATNTSDSVCCPDNFVSNIRSSTSTLLVGGNYKINLQCGLWCASYYGNSITSEDVGGRLLFIPKDINI